METALERTTVKELIERKDWVALREALANWPPPEIADLLAGLDKVDRALLFRTLPRRLSAEVFAYMSPGEEDSLLKDLTDEETRRLLAELRPDDRTLFYEAAPRVKRHLFFSSSLVQLQLSEIPVILLFALTGGRDCRRRIGGFERAAAPSIRRLSYCGQGACRARRPLTAESARWKPPLQAAMRCPLTTFALRSCGSNSVSSRHIA